MTFIAKGVHKRDAIISLVKAHPQKTDRQIQAALANKGISVTTAYVWDVRRFERIDEQRSNKKPSQTKADAIRIYYQKHPGASPTACAEHLTNAGFFDMTPQYVSTIRSMDKRKAQGGPNQEISTSDLFTVRDFVKQFGGPERTVKAIELLAKISN